MTARRFSTPIAAVGRDRALWVIDRNGHRHAQADADLSGVVWGAWGGMERSPSTFSWPSWSPDGRRLACFRLPDESHGSAQVLVMDVDGVSTTAVADLGDRLPIYLFWAPDGSRVAILTQKEERLHLASAPTDAVDGEVTLAEGSPLFFTWAGSERIAAFVGSGNLTRVALLDPRGRGATLELPGRPGNFCAPLWVGDQVVYAVNRGSHTTIVRAGAGQTEPVELEEVEGLVAMSTSPDGRHVARATAPDGDGTPYRHLALIDAETGETRTLVDRPCLAFLWCPDGRSLVTASVDTERNLLEWQRMDLDGNIDHLADLYPSRDLGFYLRFFEQYAQSHALVDPEGRTLLLTGGLLGHGDPYGDPRLWAVPLDGGAPEDLGDCVFAVFGPEGSPDPG